MRTWYVALVLAVALAVLKANKLWGSPLVDDQKLRDALKNAEPLLNTHIAAGLEKLPVIHKPKESLLRRDEFFFQINSDMTVNLQNVRIVSYPHFKVSSVNTDLEHLNMAVEGSAGTIVVVGNFYISSVSSPETSTVISVGGFRLVLESVVLKGYTGLEVAGDSLLTENYDVDYVPSAVTLTVQTGSGNSQISTSGFDGAVSATINGHLRSTMNRLLKKQFDAVARGYSLSEMFRHDHTTITKFRSHTRSLKFEVNEFVDALLKDLAKELKDSGKATISIPGKIHASFAKKVWFKWWNGSFTAKDGWVKDLTTIQRKGSMSLREQRLTKIVFGRLTFRYLQIGFNYYRAEINGIGPKGKMKAKVGSNSIFIKVTIDMSKPLKPKFTLNDLYVEGIGNIDLELTGFGGFNWLISKIASWVLDFFTEKIAKEINKHLKNAVVACLASTSFGEYL